MASMLLKPVFKAAIGLLVNKGHSLAAEKLKDDDVAGKDLAASISFLKEGVEHLYKVLDVETAGKEGRDANSTKAEEAVGGGEEKTVLETTKEMKTLQLTGLNEDSKEALSDAKERFKDARRKAVEAFGNSALSTSDRLLAMEIRIVATVLEQADRPASALTSCRLCLKDLHSYSAVRANFRAELKKGIMGSITNIGSDERNDIIVAVCQMNRFVYDVTQMVDEGVSKARELLIWPCVDVGEERIDPLRDSRIAKKLRKLGMEQFCVQPWSFGQEGEEEHRLKLLKGIAINTKGQFIIADDKYVKVFDSSGKFLNTFSPPDDGLIQDVATDRDDNMYVLVEAEDVRRGGGDVYVFDTQTKLHHSFRISPGYDVFSLVVDVSNKVLVFVGEIPPSAVSRGIDEPTKVMVQVYHIRLLLGRIEVMCESPAACLISTTGDGHVIVLDRYSRTLYLFSPQEDYPLKTYVRLRQLSRYDTPGAMTFHQASEHLFIASVNEESRALQVSLYNKDGEFVRSIPLATEPEFEHYYEIKGIAVTNNGRIAVAVQGLFPDAKNIFHDKDIVLIV